MSLPILALCITLANAQTQTTYYQRRRSLRSRIIGAVIASVALVALLILCLVARRRRARRFAQGGGPILVGPSGGAGKPPFGGFARPWGQNNAANQNQFHNQGFQQPYQTAQPGTEYPPNHGAAPVPPPYTPDHNAASFSPPAGAPPGHTAQGQYAPPPGPPPAAHLNAHEKPQQNANQPFIGGFRS
ncbi:hypothetical protein C8J57DRAFT_1274910 [Mycena rebaudengoi]|nr:hypothetical protein C8J57DRAFT_1274910 [Mycena rebaudengoi]